MATFYFDTSLKFTVVCDKVYLSTSKGITMTKNNLPFRFLYYELTKLQSRIFYIKSKISR